MKSLFTILFSSISGWASAQDTLRLSLLFAGDIMQHESQMKAAYDPATNRYEYGTAFEQIKTLISSADLAIGNLELTLGGKPYTGYPQFSAPDELLPAIKDAGFDVLVTANNHSADRGRKGIERTIEKLDSLNIPHTGTFRDTVEWLNHHPLALEKNGIKLLVLNYTYGTNGMPVRPPNLINRIDTLQIQRDLEKAKTRNSDFVIVFFHWGAEYIQTPGKDQTRVAEFCLRHGAQAVIGSHPHVLQPMEWRKDMGQVVVYSLGNFISAQRARYRNGGAVFHLDLMKVVSDKPETKTTIVDASYSLVWVNRMTDDRRSFQIVPVGDTGVDSLMIRSPAGRAMMKEFIDDSREFFRQTNKGVRERSAVLRKDQ
ncbi:MAG: CapA family protein [Cyclobacteriaceae bacterium]|nr:CapA family protein [Cyclobacteriaceae bacterium]